MQSNPPTIKLISATQVSEASFWESTYLGRSLRRIPDALRPPCAVAFSNTGPAARGLSEIFNGALDRADPRTHLVFLHDDLYLNDWFLVQRVCEALQRFDVAGLAGSTNPDLDQPSWALCFDAALRPTGWQPGLQRSGGVNHFDYACPRVSVYGPTPMACMLLDGAFLAVRTAALQQHGVRFDPRFRFHCYDIDFCRTAVERGLRLGTWPIAVTHNSGGAFGSDSFKQAARVYLDKWRGASRTAGGETSSDSPPLEAQRALRQQSIPRHLPVRS